MVPEGCFAESTSPSPAQGGMAKAKNPVRRQSKMNSIYSSLRVRESLYWAPHLIVEMLPSFHPPPVSQPLRTQFTLTLACPLPRGMSMSVCVWGGVFLNCLVLSLVSSQTSSPVLHAESPLSVFQGKEGGYIVRDSTSKTGKYTVSVFAKSSG